MDATGAPRALFSVRRLCRRFPNGVILSAEFLERRLHALRVLVGNWHRLFGLLLTDFFTGTPFVVELEKDLSLKRQLLDVVILRKGPGALSERLPDGLERLATHNLISFKSHQESLDDWTLKELTGHYVNYRKQVSPSLQQLLPEAEFRLFAVCARYPHNLAGQAAWAELQPGVYECRRGTDAIRVLVLRQL